MTHVDPRRIRVAAAQLGPIQRAEARAPVVDRLMALLARAARAETRLVVFPELPEHTAAMPPRAEAGWRSAV